MMKKISLIFISFLILLTAGCAAVPKDPAALAAYREANDPLEPMNRKIFAFNMAADKYAMRPIVKGYRKVTTPGFRLKARTFLSNLKTPLTVVNDLLQLNFKNAGRDLSRFVINSTIGFLGVYDVADRMGIAPNYQGFGTTMAVWGIPSGPYLVLPFLGPSNVRDAAGTAANVVFDPFTYISYQNDNNDVTRAFIIADIVEALAAYENSLELLDEGRKSSLDFYAYMRSMYQQYRKKTIENAKGIKTNEDGKAAYEFSLEDEFDE